MGRWTRLCTRVNIEDFLPKVQVLPRSRGQCFEDSDTSGILGIYRRNKNNASLYCSLSRRDELYKLRELGEDMDKLIQTILRSYTGVFTDHAFINEDSLAICTGLTRRQVYEQLIHLAKLHIVSYIPPQKDTIYNIHAREG